MYKRQGLDIGFAYDGDADRCIAVDHRGNIIDGDKIMYVCGKYLKEQGKLNGNTVVTTVMSNMGLYKALEMCIRDRFYTGQQKATQARGRINKFNERYGLNK